MIKRGSAFDSRIERRSSVSDPLFRIPAPPRPPLLCAAPGPARPSAGASARGGARVLDVMDLPQQRLGVAAQVEIENKV